MAEIMTRSAVWAPGDLEAGRVCAASAGTRAQPGRPLAQQAAQAMQLLGVKPEPFQARELRPELVSRAHLVLTATREHRSEVLAMQPRAMHRVFTLKEFAILTEPLPVPQWSPEDSMVDRAQLLVEMAQQRRSETEVRLGAALDVADPYGGPARGYQECARQIIDALDHPLWFLRGDGVTWPPRRGARRRRDQRPLAVEAEERGRLGFGVSSGA